MIKRLISVTLNYCRTSNKKGFDIKIKPEIYMLNVVCFLAVLLVLGLALGFWQLWISVEDEKDRKLKETKRDGEPAWVGEHEPPALRDFVEESTTTFPY